jgi:hypothetical protein
MEHFTKKDSMKAKGIAVCLLIFHHLFFIDRGYTLNLLLFSKNSLINLAVATRICVWIFVFVSSYGISTLYYSKPESESISHFIFARWFSLMKNFWIIYILVFWVLLLAGDNPMQRYNGSIFSLLLDFFAWSDLFGTPTIFGAWWYMCFAQVMILFIPVLIEVCKFFGGIISILGCFIGILYLNVGIVSSSGGNYLMYLMAIVFGILCVQYKFFERLKTRRGVSAAFECIFVLLIVILLIYCRFIVVSETFEYNNRNINYVLYSLAAVGICIIAFRLCEKHIEKVFIFLGKHSGNIFLTHMFYVRYLGKYMFFTKSVLGTWVIVTLISCITSIVIEFIKEIIQYNKWLKVLENRIWNIHSTNKVNDSV